MYRPWLTEMSAGVVISPSQSKKSDSENERDPAVAGELKVSIERKLAP
jgi:hypothetical protein